MLPPLDPSPTLMLTNFWHPESSTPELPLAFEGINHCSSITLSLERFKSWPGVVRRAVDRCKVDQLRVRGSIPQRPSRHPQCTRPLHHKIRLSLPHDRSSQPSDLPSDFSTSMGCN